MVTLWFTTSIQLILLEHRFEQFIVEDQMVQYTVYTLLCLLVFHVVLESSVPHPQPKDRLHLIEIPVIVQ
ncbi:hypothetical protein DSECCO2_613750 [anaerobic digester metagenome]|jgi:hypothetical protein